MAWKSILSTILSGSQAANFGARKVHSFTQSKSGLSRRVLLLNVQAAQRALGVGQASGLPWRSRNSRCPQTPMAVGSFVRRLYVPSLRVIFEVRALRKGVWILSPALVCPRRRRCFRTHARARSHLAQMAKRLLKSWATSPVQLVTGQARREHRTLHELPRRAHSPSGR